MQEAACPDLVDLEDHCGAAEVAGEQSLQKQAALCLKGGPGSISVE